MISTKLSLGPAERVEQNEIDALAIMRSCEDGKLPVEAVVILTLGFKGIGGCVAMPDGILFYEADIKDLLLQLGMVSQTWVTNNNHL